MQKHGCSRKNCVITHFFRLFYSKQNYVSHCLCYQIIAQMRIILEQTNGVKIQPRFVKCKHTILPGLNNLDCIYIFFKKTSCFSKFLLFLRRNFLQNMMFNLKK